MRYIVCWATLLALCVVTTAAQALVQEKREPSRIKSAERASTLRPFSVEDALNVKEFVQDGEISISRDGKLVAYALINPDLARIRDSSATPFLPSGAYVYFNSAEVCVTDAKSQKTRCLTKNWGTSYAPVWSPNGRRLAFFSDKGGKWELWVWNRDTDKMTRFDRWEAYPGWPTHLPQWSSDSRYVYFLAFPQGTPKYAPQVAPKPKPVEAQAYTKGQEKDMSGVVTDAKEKAWRESLKRLEIPSHVIEADVVRGAARRIGAETILKGQRLLISPDDAWLAVVSAPRAVSTQPHHFGYDLYVINLKENKQKNSNPIVKGVVSNGPWRNLRWSPNSKYLAVGTEGLLGGDIFLADVGKWRVENLTAETAVPGTAKSYRKNEGRLLPKFANSEPPVWSSDNASLYYAGQGNLWRISVNDPGAAKCLTEGDPRTFRSVRSLSAPTGSRKRSSVYAFADGGNQENISLVEVREDGAPLADLFTIKKTGEVSAEGFFAERGIPENGYIPFEHSSKSVQKRLYLLHPAGGKIDRVTLGQDFSGVDFAERQILTWKLPNGETASGLFLLPPGTEPGTKLPLVATLYGGMTGYGLRLNSWLGSDTVNGPEMLAGRGFAVLMPDIPLSTSEPLKEIKDKLDLALEAAIATGYVDRERIGVIGQSYGGYSVNSVAMQPGLVKCGVAVNGTSDLVSGTLMTSYGATWANIQGRMKGSFWEDPEAYRRNSPISHLDKARMPLLIIAGANDDVVPPVQSEMMFRGLAMNGVSVEYALYRDCGHAPVPGQWPREAIKDYWNRIFNWFDQCLKR